MFQNLSDRLAQTFKNLKGHGKLSEKNIADSLREVRLALLEADVNYQVAKDFVARIKDRAVGTEVMRSLTPGQMVVKIVHQELTDLMGGAAQPLALTGRTPIVLMMVGLQGSGKTTTSGKLALHLRKKGRRPLLVPADTRRPAAIEQLKKLGAQIQMPVYNSDPAQSPVDICARAVDFAKANGHDVLILDTAGRLHVDHELMAELEAIQARTRPVEVLLVADAMTGQDAVNVAEAFHQKLTLTGVVLTKVEGDARGGAALSIRAVTQVPIKFLGVGEKLDALEPFHPDRLAGRILGMGDVLSLVEKASEAFEQEQAQALAKKILGNQFTLEDFRQQLKQLEKLGSMESLLKMLPGMGKLKQLQDMKPDEKELKRTEAIISSMTMAERNDHTILNASRRKRIARGSGTSVAEVNRLLKNFLEARKMMKHMGKMGGKKRGLARMLKPF